MNTAGVPGPFGGSIHIELLYPSLAFRSTELVDPPPIDWICDAAPQFFSYSVYLS